MVEYSPGVVMLTAVPLAAEDGDFVCETHPHLVLALPVFGPPLHFDWVALNMLLHFSWY